MSTTPDYKSDNKSKQFHSKILYVESNLPLHFPREIGAIIMSYYVDKIVLTSEYHQAIYTGDLDFIVKVERK